MRFSQPLSLLWCVALGLTCSSSAAAQQSTTPPNAQQQPPAAGANELPDTPTAQTRPVLQPTGDTAVFDTSMGRITCRFFDKQAPNAVANFEGLATGTKDWQDPTTHEKMHNKPLYSGSQFHRVIPRFMIQGGDPTATGMGDPGYYFKDETDPNLNFDVGGRLAMANSGPNTNGSQFFITEQPVAELDQRYTIFGQCDDPGILVVKTIARVDRDRQDKPITPVTLNKVTIVPAGQPIPAPPAIAPPATQQATPPSGATLPLPPPQ